MAEEPDAKRPRREESGSDDISAAMLKELVNLLQRESMESILLHALGHSPSLRELLVSECGRDPSNRKVFVKDLSLDTTSESLVDAYAKFGDVEDGAVITDKTTGKSKGFGFVSFVGAIATQKALEAPSILLDGRLVRCKLAKKERKCSAVVGDTSAVDALVTKQLAAGVRSDTIARNMGVREEGGDEGTNDSGSSGGGGQAQTASLAARKLFVRGLAWQTTTETLLQHFSQFGEVQEGAVCVDREKGRSKGYGFVTYSSAAAALRALVEPSKLIDDRMTHVKFAAEGAPTPAPSKTPAPTPTSEPPTSQPPPPLGAPPGAFFSNGAWRQDPGWRPDWGGGVPPGMTNGWSERGW